MLIPTKIKCTKTNNFAHRKLWAKSYGDSDKFEIHFLIGSRNQIGKASDSLR